MSKLIDVGLTGNLPMLGEVFSIQEYKYPEMYMNSELYSMLQRWVKDTCTGNVWFKRVLIDRPMQYTELTYDQYGNCYPKGSVLRDVVTEYWLFEFKSSSDAISFLLTYNSNLTLVSAPTDMHTSRHYYEWNEIGQI